MAGAEGSDGLFSNIFPVLWFWGSSVQAFSEFSFIPQANSRQDKLLLQQITYINVNEHLICTSFSCKRWSKVGEFWQASFQGAKSANLSPGARAQHWIWWLHMQLASWLYLPPSGTLFNLCFSCLSSKQEFFFPHERNITLRLIFTAYACYSSISQFQSHAAPPTCLDAVRTSSMWADLETHAPAHVILSLLRQVRRLKRSPLWSDRTQGGCGTHPWFLWGSGGVFSTASSYSHWQSLVCCG